MKPYPSAEFEKIVADSLKVEWNTDDDSANPARLSDADFLKALQERITKESVGFRTVPVWINGLLNGVAAASIGIILFTGLNVLPPFFIKASVTGAGLVQEKIITASVQQQLVWQQLLITLQSQTKNFIKI